MKRIKDNEVFLKATTVAHVEQGKALIRTAKKGQLDSVCEVLLNIVKGAIPLKEELVKKAGRFKNILRKIVTKCFNNKSRRELMIKYFKIVQKLLFAALPLIGVILSGIQAAGV